VKLGRLADEIGQRLPLVTAAQAIESYYREDSELDKESSLLIAGVAMTEADKSSGLKLINDGLNDAEQGVRTAAIYATSYANWPEAGALLQEFIDRGVDPELNEGARSVMEAL
jgi:hypothetical protein